ncbi:MarR family winged helix-turn-helix transcriptional regulator [Uliginosibacterium sp. 31-12]|uniref:MarR family winged helix-turn-helix transcriptional regulator n=1 Tax=Uliginosibacterium sp. 31-12 TaxID=3062781 RepID=UPI0026E3D163|nr:MarR family transcriptional regulator [Uliginosibacterium sp. 31-12]MDO6386179.1 MarR family transcriptional regulator [Uliginosibacterium sp. 31-12]
MPALDPDAIRFSSSTAPEDPAERLAWRLQLLLNATRRHARRRERETGLGLPQLRALQCVQARPGLGVNELARELGLHQSTVSNMLRPLTMQGWLEARRTGSDRRTVALYLCEPDKPLPAPWPQGGSEPLPEALASLDEALLRRLDADLARVQAALLELLPEG